MLFRLNFILILLVSTGYALATDKAINSISTEQVNAREISSDSKLMADQSDFNLKKVVSNKDKAHTLVTNLISIIDVESANQVEQTLKASTQNLFIASYFKEAPLLSEFIFRLSKEPEAVSNFVMIFLQKNKLILFGMIIISSMVLSHFMGEFKFKFKLMSLKRISYSFARFGTVNSIRIGSFLLLFKENLSHLFNVYAESVTSVQHIYPTLHSLVSSLI